MNDLTPSYEADAGQVILEGRPAGPAGEAGLAPAARTDLAFDRADGHLVRVVTDVEDESAATLLTGLLGPRAMRVLRDVAAGQAASGPLAPDPVLSAALSSLARLDAFRDTSPVPRRSPWWAAEAAVLAEQAGLHARTLTEVGRLRGGILAGEPHPSCPSRLDVVAEVEGLKEATVRLPGLHWVLDPGLVPAGLFRPGLSPHSDLVVRHGSDAGRVTVEAALAPGTDDAAVGRCEARLVDPVVRRVLARADFQVTGSRVRAELGLPFPLDELGEAWIEVVEGPQRPVRSARGHLTRRALRWADAALRAERAPAGLAPQSTAEDWAALAAIAWDRCRRDWAAAGDLDRAAAGDLDRAAGARALGPACLAEIMGG